MWGRIEPLMPADPVRGRRWADHRRTLEAIAWKYRTNSPWRNGPARRARPIPDRPQKRLIRWAVAGTWQNILTAVLAGRGRR
ncbi:transposase [Streptomyces sp. NPDC002054]|uniref:transposase n=1 Tax=Streptomyces sp. NPDC002054 TaxID=3154663 RepID=UPI00331A9438